MHWSKFLSICRYNHLYEVITHLSCCELKLNSPLFFLDLEAHGQNDTIHQSWNFSTLIIQRLWMKTIITRPGGYFMTGLKVSDMLNGLAEHDFTVTPFRCHAWAPGIKAMNMSWLTLVLMWLCTTWAVLWAAHYGDSESFFCLWWLFSFHVEASWVNRGGTPGCILSCKVSSYSPRIMRAYRANYQC